MERHKMTIGGQEFPGLRVETEGNFYPYFSRFGTRFACPITPTPEQEKTCLREMKRAFRFSKTLAMIGD